MVAKNISMATNRQTPPKTADTSLDAARMTCAGQVTLPELDGVFRGLLQPSAHASAGQSRSYLGGILPFTRLFENQVKPN